MKNCLQALRTTTAGLDDNGAISIEYALIGALISVAIVTGMTAIGIEMETLLNKVVEAFK